MKRRILFKIILFFIPVILIIVVLPVNRRSYYAALHEDCFNHAIWLHDRVFINPKPVDIVFLGSSRTVNGINDSLLEKELTDIHILNAGYCRFGTNLYPVLLKDIIKNKKVKKVIFEVRESENYSSHPIYPYIAEFTDVYKEPIFFNQQILSNYYKAFFNKIEMFRHSHHIDTIPINLMAFGIATSMDSIKIDTSNLIRKPSRIAPKIEQWVNLKYPYAQIKRLSKICKKNDIELQFIYLPSFYTADSLPLMYHFYEQFGKVHVPPRYINRNKDYWYDENHLNLAGSKELAKWLAEQLEIN